MKTRFLPTVRRILRYAARRRTLLILSLSLSSLHALLSLAIPMLLAQTLNAVLAPGKVNFKALMPDLLLIALIALSIGLLRWQIDRWNNRLIHETVHDLRRDAFEKLQSLPLSYLDHHPIGEIVSRVIGDAEHFAEGMLMGLTHFLTGLLTLIGALVLMLLLHPLCALLVLLITPLSLLGARLISGRSYSLLTEQSSVRGEQAAFLEEMIGGQKLIHSFHREAISRNRFDEITRRMQRVSMKAQLVSALSGPLGHLVHHLVLALVCLLCPLAVVHGSMTVGGLLAFILYSEQFSEPFHEITSILSELQRALSSAERILQLIDQPSMADDSHLARLPDPKGEVRFENVTFSYDPDVPLLRELSITVTPGQHVAIVGATGSGKTTLINLLMRFYETQGGRITVDGISHDSVTRRSLREGFGLVLQEPWLRHGTIRENLAFGKPDATDEEIEQIATLCHAHSFIMRLEKGYDTVISEGGGELSAGQRQLLCIARTLLSDPEILILDEATSYLDSRSEARIQSAFARLLKGRTCFTVTHRLTAVQSADLILVVQDGAIVERGTHPQLMEKKGVYYAMYQSQFAH